MASSSQIRSIKLWTCCKCQETGISMTVGECPSGRHPEHSRCMDCEVKSHVATDEEVDEESKKMSAAIAGQRERETRSSLGLGMGSGSSGPRYDFLSSDRFGTLVANSLPKAGSSRNEKSAYDPRFVSNVRPFSSGDLMPISTEPIRNIYILRPEDEELRHQWEQSLRSLSQCLQDPELPRLASLHLFRAGKTELDSQPTIIVNSLGSLSLDEKEKVGWAIISGISEYGQWEFPNCVQAVFQQSKLRRTAELGSSRIPICEPRNIRWQKFPETGASIGVAGSLDDTATLGCYILLGGRPMALTVNHLRPNSDKRQVEPGRTTLEITHISEQDRFGQHSSLLAKEARSWLQDTASDCQEDCSVCTDLRVDCSNEDWWSLWTTFYKLQLMHDNDSECKLVQLLKLVRKSSLEPLEETHASSMGSVYACPGQPCRRFQGKSLREMDWMVIDLAEDYSNFSGRQHQYRCAQDAKSMHAIYPWSDIVPGSFVKSTGRTSGYQVGQISNMTSIVFHEDHVTEEWSVLPRPSADQQAWVEGGIGVDGDSGALIVDEKTNEVCGMLWGRIGEGAATVTLFTPIWEIFEHIRESTGKSVDLAAGQTMLDPASEVKAGPPSSSVALQLFSMSISDSGSTQTTSPASGQGGLAH